MGSRTQIFHPHQQALMLDYVEEWPWSFKQASEKGYPTTMNRAMYFCYFMDVECHNHIKAYTTATEIAECVYLVGNTWVDEESRGHGVHTEMLQWRNGMLKNTFGATHIYTLLNPQEGVSVEQLEKTVSRLGYRKVSRISVAAELIRNGVRYRDAFRIWKSNLPLWRLDFDC
jgi:hypothetical protein